MNLNVPKPFVYDKTKKGKDWIVWKRNFLIYLRLVEMNKKLKKEEQAFLLLNLMGNEAEKAREIITFDFEEDKEDIQVLIKKFDEVFIPAVNEIQERYTFFSRKKQNNESIDNYVMDLQEKAANCNFKDKTENFIRDMIILSMEKDLQKKALRQDLSLREVIALYKQHCIDLERNKNILKGFSLPLNIKPGCSSDISNVSGKSSKESVCWRCSTSHPPRACPAWGKRCGECNELHHFTENCNKQKQFSQNFFCKKCGTSHMYKQCPAFGVTCVKCLKKNHFSSQCKNEKVANVAEDCDWCGSKHFPGECPHNEVCPKCDKYPHKICFQCRENPHVDSCIFKELVTLPPLNNENKKTELQGSKCAWCETVHNPGADCPHSSACTLCHDFPHKICFQCRQNPHTELCIFKNLLQLPNL